MTETIEKTHELAPAVERFVLHWGEMGSQWGVNRSIAQIHALLYLSDEPLTAEDIAETLGIARSNVSTSLRELLNWDLIHRHPVRGDRRDHYVAETDLWQMVSCIAAGRKAREIDPAAALLRTCVEEAEGDHRVSATALKRLQDMLAFVDAINRWYAQMLKVPKSSLATLIKMGSGVVRFLGARGPREPEDSSQP